MDLQFILVSALLFLTAVLANDSASRCKRQLSSISNTCFLQPEIEQGPYYWNSTYNRANVTEGRQGVPFLLQLTTIDVNTCEPVVQAAVEIWHCDAVGVYSHYIQASNNVANPVNDNSTFLRGLQFTNSTGQVTFITIYPGWYTGRSTHIHLKVHVGGAFSNSTGVYSNGTVTHTSQLFFNDTLTDLVALQSPYSNHTITRTLNSVDRVYTGQNGSYSVLSLSYVNADVGLSGGVIGTIVLGINSTVVSSATTATVSSTTQTITTTKATTTTASTSVKAATTSKTVTTTARSSTVSNQGNGQNPGSPNNQGNGQHPGSQNDQGRNHYRRFGLLSW